MFVAITNTPRDYAWGAPGAISSLFGGPASSAPEAELWFGSHSGSPSRIIEPDQAGGCGDLASWIASDPGTALGDPRATRLPFLLKVLAAASPLSLQAHPTPEHAAAGYARENALGIALDAPERNYRDPFAKPELILAVSERFDALCGFRPVAESRAVIEALLARAGASFERGPLRGWLAQLERDGDIRAQVEHLISRGEGVAELITAVSSIARDNPERFPMPARLAQAYPGDPGVVISLLLHNLSLSRGEALYLPAGNIHAYLSGVGIELMSSSDNVLRGGLSPKHIDVPELLSVLDFSPREAPVLEPEPLASGGRVFRPGIPDFELYDFAAEGGSVSLLGPAIALCVAGAFSLSGQLSSGSLRAGDAVYVTTDELALISRGSGQLVIATTGRPHSP